MAFLALGGTKMPHSGAKNATSGKIKATSGSFLFVSNVQQIWTCKWKQWSHLFANMWPPTAKHEIQLIRRRNWKIFVRR